MGQVDARSNLGLGVSINSVTVHDSTENGSTVEVADFMGAAFVGVIEDYTDGDIIFKAQHSDDDSTWVDVPSDELDGEFEKHDDDSEEGEQQWVGYKGSNKYLRLSAVSTSAGSTGSKVGTYVVMTHPRRGPAQEAEG